MPETGSKSSGRLLYELLDETLDLNKTHFYHLSIQVRRDGLLFSILDPGESRYLGIKHYGFDRVYNPDKQYDEVKELLNMDPFLSKPYSAVSCIFNDARSTLLPEALFDTGHLKLYFEFNQVLNELDELHYNRLKQADAYLVFPVYSEIAGLFLKRWLNTSFFNQSTPVIETMLSMQEGEGITAGVNFNEDHFDIILTGNNKLQYHNNFSFRTEEDLVYFLLFVFNKFNLEQESTPLFLSGEVDKFSDRLQVLRRYFKKIVFQQVPPSFRYPSNFQKVQEHSLLSLLKIEHCE